MEEDPTATGASSHPSSRPASTATISGPLSTDSMVTVRLSDIQNASSSIPNDQVCNHVAILAGEHPGSVQETSPVPMDTNIDSSDYTAFLEQRSRDNETEARFSIVSSRKDEQSICTSNTIRFRSETLGSVSSSSSGSAQVDWEELERSEEQAPRDDGSDEVSYHIIYTLVKPP